MIVHVPLKRRRFFLSTQLSCVAGAVAVAVDELNTSKIPPIYNKYDVLIPAYSNHNGHAFL